MADAIHIKRKDAVWLVERGNYLLGEFKSQAKAVELGRQRARSSHSELVVHSEDGAIASQESFNDARRRKAG